MSREKGKRGERTVASLFKEYGYDAKRSAQFCGKTGQAADVVGVPLIHIEVKFQERMCLYDWMNQAIRDSVAEGKGNERIRRVRRFFVVLLFIKAVLFLVHNML